MTGALLLWLASAALASSGPAPCAVMDPPSLQELTACQRKALVAATAAFVKSHDGQSPDDELVDAWQKLQDAETQDYIRRHKASANKKGRRPRAPADAIDDAQLRDDLWKLSSDGKSGVTPEMSREIVDYLQKKQGDVSPEMRDLLESLQKDGANLTPDTMSKVKKAARDADGAGLDLGVDPKTKELLLDRAHDPPTQPPATD